MTNLNNLNEKTIISSDELKKYFVFEKNKLVLQDKYGKQNIYYFIIFKSLSTHKMTVTSYSRYLLIDLINLKPNTVNYHAKIVVSFLNYVFLEKYKEYKLNDITNLKIQHGEEFLRDYASGKINGKKTDSTIITTKNILSRFYYFLYREYKSKMKYISERDFQTMKFSNRRYKRNNYSSYIGYLNLFKVVLPGYVPPKRIKSISINLFRIILKYYKINHPNLVLAICFQAFGGLRAGEVCNITQSKLNWSKEGNDFKNFTVDLREKIKIRDDAVDVGSIKKPRIQAIHPLFLETFKVVYKRHMKMIKNTPNKYNALFLNSRGDAITYQSYSKIFKNAIKNIMQTLNEKDDYESMSELNILMSGRIGTHVFRHFFTQQLVASNLIRSSAELAYWRGDSNLNSSTVYLANSYYVDENIKDMQYKMMKLILDV